MTKIAPAAFVLAAALMSAAAPVATAAPPRVSAGQTVFETNCAGCHGANGAGVRGLFPSLVANPYVSGDAKRLIHTVKHGLTGKIVAKGVSYNGVMPPWNGTLSATQIADVITYIRTSLGNKASAVTPAQVRSVAK